MNTTIQNNKNKTTTTKSEGIKKEGQIEETAIKKLPVTGM